MRLSITFDIVIIKSNYKSNKKKREREREKQTERQADKYFKKEIRIFDFKKKVPKELNCVHMEEGEGVCIRVQL